MKDQYPNRLHVYRPKYFETYNTQGGMNLINVHTTGKKINHCGLKHILYPGRNGEEF